MDSKFPKFLMTKGEQLYPSAESIEIKHHVVIRNAVNCLSGSQIQKRCQKMPFHSQTFYNILLNITRLR